MARRSTPLGISFRPFQAAALGLDPRETLTALLALPFQVVRLGAYWSRLEPEPGAFQPQDLDWQLEAAERAGKQVILCLGPVKTFGYPEFFVPGHHLDGPIREGSLVDPRSHRQLLDAATAFVARVVDRYRDREAVEGWQVEHEAVDPLGMEHSWRLSASFVEEEVRAVRNVDPSRPIVMNGFLPTTLPVGLQQWWRTRDQGDSLAVAQRLADVVGVDYYPRHALAGAAGRTLYLDGGRRPGWRRARRLLEWARSNDRRLMISEGQAEPWETVTTPPSPPGHAMYSCPPERLIENYNQCLRWAGEGASPLAAYLFWGAEYWVLRRRDGDPRYLGAFARLLEES
ncbi:MAG: beta-galactosidase [Candidatus Dormibacteraeota bacterium]|nr:beta-galactosidase [Candidatus Dormibacteraeota bacterium]